MSRIIFVALVLFLYYTEACGRSTSCSTSSSSDEGCECPKNIKVRITIQNILQPKFFEKTTIVQNTDNRLLISYLEKAAKTLNIKFKSTYFPTLGYFIDSINGLAGKWDPDRTYWEILDEDNEQLQLGVSSYIPTDEQHITFNFTQGGH